MLTKKCQTIALVTLVALTLIGCKPNTDADLPTAKLTTHNYTIEVTGMHCDACANSIQTHLKQTAGVVGCEVSFESGVADIQATDQATAASLTEAIEALGFQAKVESEG